MEDRVAVDDDTAATGGGGVVSPSEDNSVVDTDTTSNNNSDVGGGGGGGGVVSTAAARTTTPGSSRKRQTPNLYTVDLPDTTTNDNKKRKQKSYEFQNERVAKYFVDSDEPFLGTVVGYREILETTAHGRQKKIPTWSISYDDGDKEDMERSEVKQAMKLHLEGNRKKVITTKTGGEKKNTKTKTKPKEEAQPKKGKTKKSDTSSGTFPYKNARVAKYFEKMLYYGKITSCFVEKEEEGKNHNTASKQEQRNPHWLWHVLFDDGDQEDWDLGELQLGLSLFEKAQSKKTTGGQGTKNKSDNNNNNLVAATTTTTKTYSKEHIETPIETDHGNFYQVQEILDRRFKKMKGDGVEVVQYLVSWKDNTMPNEWLNSEQLDPNSLAEAFRKFPPTTGNDVEDNVVMEEVDDDKQQQQEEKDAATAAAAVTTKSNDATTTTTTKKAVPSPGVASANNNNDTALLGDNNGEVMENFDSEDEEDYDEEEGNGLREEIDHIAESNYNRRGSAEVVINRKTYRIGMSFYTDRLWILTISDLIPEKQMAECTCYIPSKQTFIDQPNDQLPKDTYVQLGPKKTVPFSDLKRSCKITIPRAANWIYDFDPVQKHSKFCYYKNTGKVPMSVPGKNKPTVLELFAGAGGMTCGFANAGMETKWVVESNESAAATLKSNHSNNNVQVYTEDIRDFLAGSRAGDPAYPKRGDVDHIHGSPPCQGFSRANRVGGDEAVENNNLTYEFINAIRHFDPNTATYENVPGILLERNRPYLQSVITQLLSLGYQVRLQILQSSNYGDPQNRKRVFLWAAKCHMILPSTPQCTHGDRGSSNSSNLLPRRTVKDAIGHLEDETSSTKNLDITEKRAVCYPNGVIDHNFRTVGSAPHNETFVLRANRPSRTIVGVPTMLSHYNGNRLLTVREMACLQSFPWDYRFFGTIGDQFKQVGNAVPVMMATQVARAVAKVYGLP